MSSLLVNKENSDNNRETFYAVCLAIDAIPDTNQLKDLKLVLDNRPEAEALVKKFKGSRFKAFNTIEEAVLFSKDVIKSKVDSFDPNIENRNIEKSLSPFNGLHSTELSKLRKAIESDNYETVERLIWSNPRYLVSSGDTPTVLMEGPRYNACHIAAKSAKHRILNLILNTVSNPKFMKLLFPFDTNQVTESRIDFLLDLYLNTPDKGCCETPLHFGCKIGSIETVSLLLSYPKCDSEKPNKFGRKASEIVCDRNGDQKVKREILRLFESQLYIPLIRDEFSAQFGQPFKGLAFNDKRLSGLAGPMSPEQADQLFQTLKSPRKCTPKDRRIRLTDSRKGLERIARNLCKDLNINWTEFWPFLNTRIDLSSEEGLNLLERHLRYIYYKLDSCASKGMSSRDLKDEDFNNCLFSISTGISNLSLNYNVPSDYPSITKIDRISDYLDNESKTSGFLYNSSDERNCEKMDSDSDSDDSFSSALSSPEYMFEFYINGEELSKEDIDAALAVQHIIETDDCLKYDFLQNWFRRVQRERPQHFDTNSRLSSTPIK